MSVNYVRKHSKQKEDSASTSQNANFIRKISQLHKTSKHLQSDNEIENVSVMSLSWGDFQKYEWKYFGN